MTRTIDPRIDPAWDLFLRETDTTIFHSPAWMDAITQTYETTSVAAAIIEDAGTIKAGLPYAVIDDVRSRRVVVLPFSDFCDPITSSPEQWNLLADELIGLGIPISLRCMRNELPMADPRFSLSGTALWHGVDLSADVDSIRFGFHPSAKNKIDKAQKSGISVRAARDLGDLRAFFNLHLRVRKYRHGLLVQPFRFFEILWHSWIATDQGVLLLATIDGEVVGGTILLEWRDTLFYKFSAMSRDHMQLGTDDLLIWNAVLQAKERDLTFLDLGLSDSSQRGLIEYKGKFASEDGVIHSLTHVPPGLDTSRDIEFGALMTAVVELFAAEEMPDSVTEAAGDTLYSYFA